MTDKCAPIRDKLKLQNVDISKYNMCYTKSLTVQNDSECSLCRFSNNSYICRPNEHDEEIYTPAEFCTPLKNTPENDLSNKYYPEIINSCKKLHQTSKSSKSSKSYKRYKSSTNPKRSVLHG